MDLKIVYLMVFSMLSNTSFSQEIHDDKQKIDELIFKSESVVNAALNIQHYVVAKYSDSDTTHLYNIYIVDTVKRILYKCIYECTYSGLEEVTFYYYQNKLIKATVKEYQRNNDPFNAVYYFSGDSLVYKLEQGRSSAFKSWNIESIKEKSRSYLKDFKGICNYLDNRK